MAFVLGGDTKPHRLKLSTILWNYAEPLLKYAPDASHAPAMLRAAALYWNLSFLPEELWRQEVQTRIARLPEEDHARAWHDAERMIERRWALYPHEQRRIDDLRIREVGSKLQVSVTSVLG